MSITLDGTNGITTPDVTSTGLTADTTTLVVDDVNNRVGIGTSSPNDGLHFKQTNDGGDIAARIQNNSTTSGSTATLYFTTTVTDTFNSAFVGTDRNNALILGSNTAERARIDASGNFLFNKTGTDVVNAGIILQKDTYGRINFVKSTASGTGGTTTCGFYYNGTSVGSIVNTSTATAYNTASDYRLKENWVAVADAATRVKALKPVNFAWKIDGKRVDGFLAHELAEVVPEAVSGEKDAVDADGTPMYQGIDQSKLVPLLTAALQEALTKIESLTARVEALEANNV